MSCLRANADGVSLTVRAQSKASRTALVGVHGDALKIAVQAPPVDGAANEALVEFLAEVFGLPRKAVTLRSGATGRDKAFMLSGISEAAARARLGELL